MTGLWIAIAGALGSLSRYLVGAGVNRLLAHRSPIPAGTLLVNLLGSLLMGLVVGALMSRSESPTRAQLAVTVGFLGGFTTYSAFALETVILIEKREIGATLAYVGLTLFLAGLACFAGLYLGRRL